MNHHAPGRTSAQDRPDPEFRRIADQVHPTGQRLGHRQHVELAWRSIRHYGDANQATAQLTQFLRHLAATGGHPEKYHHTMTQAWAKLIAHHLTSEHGEQPAGDFGSFIDRHPKLLDKELLGRHYSPAVLASPTARHSWVEPDLRPFPDPPAPSRDVSPS